MSCGSNKGTQIYYHFSHRVPAGESPPGAPVVSLGREILPCRAFLHLSQYMSYCLSLWAPVSEPPPCSLTGSPETGILRQKSHWQSKVILFSYSFILSLCVPEYPKRSPPTYIQAKYKVTFHGPSRSRQAYIQWVVALFPKGHVVTLLPIPECHAALGTVPSI